MRAPYAATEPHIAAPLDEPQASTPDVLRFWSAFSIIGLSILAALAWWVHSPNQDHFASIPMNGDGSWFYNYEPGFEMQDLDVLYGGIGHFIENAQKADTIFVGWYRSATNGNWALDNWPNYRSDKNAPIVLKNLGVANGAAVLSDRADDPTCPAIPEEIRSAKAYIKEIDRATVLIQMPSTFACAQRVHEIAKAVGVSDFTVDPTQYSSVDGGGHLDGISAHKWSTQFFAWLEHSPEFQRVFRPAADSAAPRVR